MKKFARKKCQNMFLKAVFFPFGENFFQSFCTKLLSLLYMRSLAIKISHCLSANHNPELRCVICTGVTLFALVLHLNCTALSQSESSNFFMCIIRSEITLAISTLNERAARVRFEIKSMIADQNCTTRSSNTILLDPF